MLRLHYSAGFAEGVTFAAAALGGFFFYPPSVKKWRVVGCSPRMTRFWKTL
jgi:hypothetical protein